MSPVTRVRVPAGFGVLFHGLRSHSETSVQRVRYERNQNWMFEGYLRNQRESLIISRRHRWLVLHVILPPY